MLFSHPPKRLKRKDNIATTTRQRRAIAHRYPLPHGIVPAAAGPATIAAADYIARCLHDARPRNHPDGLTPEHDTEITIADLARAIKVSARTATRAVAELEQAFQVIRRPGRPLRFRHRHDVAERARKGNAWMPWTDEPRPATMTAAAYALASWSHYTGRLNRAAIRRTGQSPTEALTARAGMTAPTFRRALEELRAHGAITGELADRSLRLDCDKLAAAQDCQDQARRVPPPPLPFPLQARNHRRPHRIVAEPPTRARHPLPAAAQTPGTRRRTPAKFRLSHRSGRTSDGTELKIIPKQVKNRRSLKISGERAAAEIRFRTEQGTHPITNPPGLTAALTWCYTRPEGAECGRNHHGPCGETAETLHRQRRTEHEFLQRAQHRKEETAAIWASIWDKIPDPFQPAAEDPPPKPPAPKTFSPGNPPNPPAVGELPPRPRAAAPKTRRQWTIPHDYHQDKKEPLYIPRHLRPPPPPNGNKPPD